VSELAVREATFIVERGEPEIAPDEPLPIAMQRITVDLLGRAISDLRPREQAPFDPGIHAARKKMKRLRGILRLARDQIGRETYRNANVVLRNTARSLSPVRDSWVLVETVREIRQRYADLLDEQTFTTTESWLLDRHHRQRSLVTGQTITSAVANLSTARRRFAVYPIEDVLDDEYASIAPGIGRVYRRGRRGFRRAAASRRTADLHEWRKRVKYLRYQMETLIPMQRMLIAAQSSELDTLGEILGDDHDLAVLEEVLLFHPDACPDGRERWLLVALIYENRTLLQAQATRMGRALYGESTGAFVSRIGDYWSAARA